MLDKWWKKLILEEKKIVYKLTSWQFSSISGELPRATSAWFRRARSHIFNEFADVNQAELRKSTYENILMKCADVNQAELRKSTYDDFWTKMFRYPARQDRTLTRASGRGRDERAGRNFKIWGSAKEMDPDFKKTIPNSRGKLLLNLSLGRLAGFKTGKYAVCLTIIH